MSDEVIRMSHSSCQLQTACSRKYYLKKIEKVPVDIDVVEDYKHFKIGKIFHTAIENCLHEKDAYHPDLLRDAAKEHEHEVESDLIMIQAMINKYFELHSKSGLTCISCEDEIGDENVIGFVDAVMKDANDWWYICDLKTTGFFNTQLMAKLKKDQQLNLYSFYRNQLADKLGLDRDKFRGCLYRATTKCRIKKNRRESDKDFLDRCMERIESYSIFVPAEELAPEAAFKKIMDAQAKAMAMKGMDREDIPQNFDACFDWNRSCEWFSKCWGFIYSEAEEQFPVENTYSVKPMCGPDDELDFL